MASREDNETCLSDEAGRASDVYRAFAVATMVITILVVSSGAILWWRQRHDIWLKRRNPFLVWLIIIPLMAQLETGPLYRQNLNDPDNFFSSCFVFNFFYILVVPTFVIPSTARIMSFYYRLKLHETLSQYHRRNNTRPVENPMVSLRNPIFFRAKVKKSSLFKSKGKHLDAATFADIKRARFKAGWRYASGLAVTWTIVTCICGIIYASSLCNISQTDQSDCKFASNTGVDVVFLVLPLVPVLALYIYFRNLRSVREAPDPFSIKSELDVFMLCLFVSGLVILLNFADPGNFSKTGDKSDEDIYFKWIQLIDILALMGIGYIIHWQVYKATKFNKSIKKSVPMGLDEILAHRDGSELFEVFLQTDFSVENLLVYKLISRWKENFVGLSNEQRIAQANKIFRQWLDPSASIDGGTVNVSGSSVENLSLALEKEEGVGMDLFDEIVDEIVDLMEQDSFIRFVNTDEYKIFVGAQDAENVSQIS